MAFNPIKEEIGGKQAQAVIWDTKTLDAAIDGLNMGRKLVANPFYENNAKLLKPELVFKRTPEETEEYIKCMNDIIYFTKYCKLMTPTGIRNVTLRDYQEDYLKHLMDTQLSIFLSCRQSGKCFLPLTRLKITINNRQISRYFDKFKVLDYYEIPVYELYNYFNKKGLKNKIRYWCYKVLDKLEVK